ncbi:hypothetical protein Nepgr_022424 [Nepenthes gracilis]|uniref:Uncharacterized protein n=1 Tax=Nepenthes gracilis TaxID=150966 RepID=A0AAD3SYT6_NEPGR|nr:hypothetical protein Nepgr_022424 [Nepenthes gracilis]
MVPGKCPAREGPGRFPDPRALAAPEIMDLEGPEAGVARKGPPAMPSKSSALKAFGVPQRKPGTNKAKYSATHPDVVPLQ